MTTEAPIRPLLLALVACAPDAPTPAPPPLPMTWAVPTLERGRTATIDVTGGPALRPVALAATANLSGPPACPAAIAPECMDLSAPFVLLALDATDASGSVTFDLSVPADLPFDEVALQAIAREPGAVYATPAATVDVVDPALRVLVFTRTQGFRHGSISDGLTLLDTLALSNGWTLTTTEDPVVLATALPDTDVVVFLSTSGDVLGPLEEDALEAWVRGGGGWVGVHAASDTEYGWPFYGELVGAWFDNHPSIQVADLHVEDPTHPATEDLPSPWSRRDEWYNFQRNPRPDVDVLLTLDETTYSGGQMGADHPIAWSQTLDAGRAFYTALGHTSATYAEPAFQDHLEGAIVWAGQ